MKFFKTLILIAYNIHESLYRRKYILVKNKK